MNARPHSGSYSRRFSSTVRKWWVNSTGIMDAISRRISGGSAVGRARISPSMSPTFHWSPSQVFHAAKTGPMAWRMPGPTAGAVWLANSGGSSHTAARIAPGLANADSHAESSPPDDMPLTIVGRPITRSMNRSRSAPKMSIV